jgi:hypothetical protein
MHALRDRAQEWLKENRNQAPPTAQTSAYIDLVFSFGLARLGESDQARKLLATSKLTLAGKNEAHTWLFNAFEYRIRQALEGKPHSSPLPTNQLKSLESMERLDRYVVDRLRKHSRVLEPDQRINPYRQWTGRISDLDKALAELTDLTDRNEIVNRVDRLLRTLPDGSKGNEQRARALKAGLEAAPRVGEEFARKMLKQTITTYDALPEPREMAAVTEQMQFLEKALFVAGYFGQVEAVQQLVTRFQRIPKAQHSAQALHVLDELVAQAVRTLCKLRMRDEIDQVLRQVTELVLKGRQIKQIDFKKEKQGPAALRCLLRVAQGWYFLGRDSQVEPILQSAWTLLLANNLLPRDQTLLACAYAEALGRAPVEVAQKRLEEMFRLKGIKDTYTTSSHFSASQLDVVESVVLAALDCSRAGRGQ